MLLRSLLVCIALCLATACASYHARETIDSDYAVRVVQKALAIQEPSRAEKLHGGLSAQLYAVTTPHKKYVVRFLSTRPAEIITSRL